MKNKVQRFGKFLSGMVMPNIGALIAFGFLAALFIDTGWIPNKGFSSMVGPMLTYLIPVLIASTGGRMIGGDRGRVVGAIAVIGAIMSNTEITMLMAAMVMGPLAGYCIKKFDQAMEGRMPAGFEMLINNFSAGLIGMILAMLGYVAIGPVMSAILVVLSAGVNGLVDRGLLPLVSVFIEPAKVLFLNNAINHGVFTPIATAQVTETGKSIMYMLEPNPGPGLGVLLAYMFFCKDKATKDSAPGAVIIHLLGGIHEIYFPYILMNPVVLIAPILGSFAGIFWFNMTGCGLVGPASQGGRGGGRVSGRGLGAFPRLLHRGGSGHVRRYDLLGLRPRGGGGGANAHEPRRRRRVSGPVDPPHPHQGRPELGALPILAASATFGIPSAQP